MRADPFDETALTRDAFLGGRVTLLQPKTGYRAGVDPVLLAASIQARPSQKVLELGCGAGPALCCLAERISGLKLAGLELQPGYADLARRNLALNALQGEVFEGSVSDPPKDLKQISFDHVIANPPFFDPTQGIGPSDGGREVARAGITPLDDWVACAARRAIPGGTVTMILRADRLPDLMSAMSRHLGTLTLLPLLPRAGRAPRLVLMTGRKGGRGRFRYLPGLVMHEGGHHNAGKEAYTAPIRAVLRDGAALPLPD